MHPARARVPDDEASHPGPGAPGPAAVGTRPLVPGAPVDGAWADEASATSVAALIRQADVTQIDTIIHALDAAAGEPRCAAHVALRIDGLFCGQVSPRDLEGLRRLALSRRATAPAPMSVAPAVDHPADRPTAAPAPPAADGQVHFLDRAMLTTAFGRAGVAIPFTLTPTLTGAQIAQLVTRLTGGTPSLASYGPRIGLLHILQNIGEVPLHELSTRIARLQDIAVMRPDGYMVRASDGVAIEQFGGGRGEVRDGHTMFGPFAAGGLYVNNSNLYYRAGPALERASGPIGEGGLVHDLPNRVLDGVQGALGSIVHGIAQLIREPIRSIAGLAHLPGAAVALLRASPELWERFRTMPLGDQVQLVSRVVSELLLLYGTAEGTTTRITETMGEVHEGMQVMRQLMTLRLSPAGTIVREAVAVRPGVMATAIGGGPGAVFILHMANQNASGGGSSDGSGSGSSSGSGEPASDGAQPPADPAAARSAPGREIPPPPTGAAPPSNLEAIMADAPAGARAIYPAELGSGANLTLLRAWMRLEANGTLHVRISNFQGTMNAFETIGNLRTLARRFNASALEIEGDLFVAAEDTGEQTRIQRLVEAMRRRGYTIERNGEHTRLLIPSL